MKLQQNTLDMDSAQIEMKSALEKAGEEHEKRVKLVCTRIRAIVKTILLWLRKIFRPDNILLPNAIPPLFEQNKRLTDCDTYVRCASNKK